MHEYLDFLYMEFESDENLRSDMGKWQPWAESCLQMCIIWAERCF